MLGCQGGCNVYYSIVLLCHGKVAKKKDLLHMHQPSRIIFIDEIKFVQWIEISSEKPSLFPYLCCQEKFVTLSIESLSIWTFAMTKTQVLKSTSRIGTTNEGCYSDVHDITFKH